MITVSKTDLLTPSQQGEVMALLASPEPLMPALCRRAGQTAAGGGADTGSFSGATGARLAEKSCAANTCRKRKTTASAASSISAAAVCAGQFYRVINGDWGGGKLLRSKAFWLATRPAAGQWSEQGASPTTACGHHARHPARYWPQDPEARAHIQEKWVEPLAICARLVFIGQHLQQATIVRLLDDCLLSDDEMAAGVDWLDMADPFPEW